MAKKFSPAEALRNLLIEDRPLTILLAVFFVLGWLPMVLGTFLTPDAERVNLGGVACFFLPSSLQQSCNARPEESKGE